jgi:predicted HicB family RNase H-like nuclease
LQGATVDFVEAVAVCALGVYSASMPKAKKPPQFRNKPRLNLTFDEDLRGEAETMADDLGLSLSQFLEKLVRDEIARRAKRGA